MDPGDPQPRPITEFWGGTRGIYHHPQDVVPGDIGSLAPFRQVRIARSELEDEARTYAEIVLHPGCGVGKLSP